MKHARSNKTSISSFLLPLRILTRVTSLKQVMYDFGQMPHLYLCSYFVVDSYLYSFYLFLFYLLLFYTPPSFPVCLF